MTPQAATTRPKRAGKTILRVGRLPKLLPAAVTMKTPCSYSAFTASAHTWDARPPMLNGDDVDSIGARCIQRMHVVERPGDGAVLEKHDPVGDPHRHDLRERRSAQQRLAR